METNRIGRPEVAGTEPSGKLSGYLTGRARKRATGQVAGERTDETSASWSTSEMSESGAPERARDLNPAGAGSPTSSPSVKTIPRDQAMRMDREDEAIRARRPSIRENPAPMSSALGIPTLLDGRGSRSKPADVGATRSASAPSLDNPAPFSSLLGIPTLLNESKPVDKSSGAAAPEARPAERARANTPEKDNPAPLSSALGIPTLINESKPVDKEARRETSDARSAGVAATPADNPAPLSSALGAPILTDETTEPPRR